jgi:hypothetical protein
MQVTTDNYAKMVQDNLERLYGDLPNDLAQNLPGEQDGEQFIFYEADDDFPASVTCLFSNNANQFLPVDGLADVGEYTSRNILNLID